MFGGVGSIVPNNYIEYLSVIVMMVFGSFVWAWVIGSLCGILATLNPQGAAFRNTMDELNYFMKKNGFLTDYRVRLREFFRQTEEFERRLSYNRLLEKMPAQLRGDTALLMGEEVLRNVWYLKSDFVEKEFLAVIALNMHHAVYETKERMPTVDLTVMLKGMAALRLKISTKGGVFGEDCLIPEKHSGLRDATGVSCLSFVMVAFITRKSLFGLVQNFPAANHWLVRCSRILMLRSGMTKYLIVYKREQRRRSVERQPGVQTMTSAEIARLATTGSSSVMNPFFRAAMASAQAQEQHGVQAQHGVSAATVFADLMYAKKMNTLKGAACSEEDEAKEKFLRRSLTALNSRVEDTRSLQADQTQRLDQLTRQQELMDQKMETRIALLTQIVTSIEMLKGGGRRTSPQEEQWSSPAHVHNRHQDGGASRSPRQSPSPRLPHSSETESTFARRSRRKIVKHESSRASPSAVQNVSGQEPDEDGSETMPSSHFEA